MKKKYNPKEIMVKTKKRPKEVNNKKGNKQWQVKLIPQNIRQQGYTLFKIDQRTKLRDWTIKDTQILCNLAGKGFTLKQCAAVMNVNQTSINRVVSGLGYKNYKQFLNHYRQDFNKKYKDILYYNAFQLNEAWAIKLIGQKQIYTLQQSQNNGMKEPVEIIFDQQQQKDNKVIEI